MPSVARGRSGAVAVSDPWADAKAVIGSTRVSLGPQASQQWLEAPEHLAMVLARYRAAAALIGDAESVLEIGCGEGIGAGILAKGRRWYIGVDADTEAIEVAQTVCNTSTRHAVVSDILASPSRQPYQKSYGAVVSLDVIEHIPANCEEDFMQAVMAPLGPNSVCVIGTPSASFEHLASPQSKAGHINLYTHDRLRDLMRRYFHTVQMFGMQDTALHFGHPDARHYHLAVGIGPR